MKIDLARIARCRKGRIVAHVMLAAACLAPTLSQPAAAKSLAKPSATASGSIQIAVSVAPRFRLAWVGNRPGARARAGVAGQYCIETNGPGTNLPVMIMWQPANAVGAAPGLPGSALLAPCGQAMLEPNAAAALGGGPIQAVTILPE